MNIGIVAIPGASATLTMIEVLCQSARTRSPTSLGFTVYPLLWNSVPAIHMIYGGLGTGGLLLAMSIADSVSCISPQMFLNPGTPRSGRDRKESE